MWISQRHAERQSPAGLFRSDESQPGTVHVVRASNDDRLTRFLKFSCRHDFIYQPSKLDVGRQPDTDYPIRNESEWHGEQNDPTNVGQRISSVLQ